MKAFVIDVAKCNGCFNCQVVCKDEHCGNDWSPYAKPQPETGQFWMKVDEKVRGQVPWVRLAYIPSMCMHCDEAPCAAACPTGAYERRDDGLLVLNPETCIGCKRCLGACPAGAIYFNEELGISQKCTGCAHLLDNGWSEPRCVDACTTDALAFGEEEELAELLGDAAALGAVAGCKPRVYYRNLPKRFVAGSVFDPVTREVVIGAQVTLREAQGGQVACKETDEFGDFVFQQVEAQAYVVEISAQGYEDVRVEADLSETDLSLGDIAVQANA